MKWTSVKWNEVDWVNDLRNYQVTLEYVEMFIDIKVIWPCKQLEHMTHQCGYKADSHGNTARPQKARNWRRNKDKLSRVLERESYIQSD